MTTDDPTLDEITELLGFLAVHADTIPPHRRRQAVLILERLERLVPLPDHDVDALEDPQ